MVKTHLGSPLVVEDWMRPAREQAGEGVTQGQAIAADPEIQLQLEQAYIELPKKDPRASAVLGALLIYMAHLRFRHVQRSVLTRLCGATLYGACTRGKGRPGFRWSMPRFGPGGLDVGLMIWESWHRVSSSGVKRYLIFEEEQGGALSMAEFHRLIRAVLGHNCGIDNAQEYTSYSSRRAMPTLALMRGATEEETAAMGEWQTKKKASMPVRYAEEAERQAASAMAKLLQVELVRRAAKRSRPLSWEAMRLALGKISVESVRLQVNEEFCKDYDVDRVPEDLISSMVKPVRRFKLAGLAFSKLAKKRACSSKPGTPGGEDVQEIAWCVNAYNGKKVIHIMDEAEDIPGCRKGWASRKRLACPVASGRGRRDLEALQGFEGWACRMCEARSSPGAMSALTNGLVRDVAHE